MSSASLKHTRRPRAGRMFAPVAERRLESTVRQVIPTLPNAISGLLAVREVAGPFGVPDFMVVVGDPGRLTKRRRTRVAPLLNEVDAGIIAATFVSRPSTPAGIAMRLGWSLPSVERRLPQLLRSGALQQTRRGSLVRLEGLETIGCTFAIEAKVRDWRRALTQCRTYRLWADSYVLVLAEVSTNALETLTSAVRADGGGLVVGDEVVLRPRVGRLRAHRRLWGSEHVYAATVGP